MNLIILSVLVFVVTLALVLGGIYFFFEAPTAKRKLRRRLELVKDDIERTSGEGEGSILRSELLSKIPFLHKLLLRMPAIRKLQLFLQQSAMDVTAGMLLTLALLGGWVAFLIVLLFGFPILAALLFGILAFAIPFLVIALKRQRRFLRFEEQFPDALDLLARAVRAGHAFTTGLDLIAKEMPAPLSEEFQRTYEEQNLGLPLRDALENLTRRMPLTDVRIFVTALVIQKESGGNLAEILDNISSVIRERFKLMRQVRVFTAQGRVSLYVLTAIGPVMCIMLYLTSREYITTLFTDPMGIRFIIVAIVLQVIGYFTIRKITQPKF